MTQPTPSPNGHTHTKDTPAHTHEGDDENIVIEEIRITYDRFTGVLSYQLKDVTYADAIGRLALTQHLMYDDLRKRKAEEAAKKASGG